MRRVRRHVRWSLAILFALAPALISAQGNKRTTLAVAGFPLSGTASATTDFDAGAITLNNTTITVNLTTNSGGGGFSPRVTTVNVRCNTPCPASGTALATLEYRNVTNSGPWIPLTTTFQQVDSKTVAFNGADDPWVATVGWRYALAWQTSAPATATAFYIQFELAVTAP
jgi:hypothetical protein